MTTAAILKDHLGRHIERRRDRLVEITRELIRIPSENKPPAGQEQECQAWVAKTLSNCGLKPDLYGLNDVAELFHHPLYVPGRSYANRANVAARRKGSGSSGRSLLLSGHIDTVPVGSLPWTREPFAAAVEGNRIYGRGSNDMKGGIATNLFLMECLAELEIEIGGDVIFESVVDEEFGGCHGTLAGRLRGYNADAAILTEPSSLRICPAQRGGRTAHITFRASGGILDEGRFPAGTIPQVTAFLEMLPAFAKSRKASAPIHEMYARHADPVPVSITKIFTGPWGTGEPIGIPERSQIEMYWQLMPGETQANVEREFFDWLRTAVQSEPNVFREMPDVAFPIRWLPGCSIARGHQLVQELGASAQTMLGAEPLVEGIEGPCDLFIFQQVFGIPAVLWGATGGNTHAADEYVEIDSLVAAAKAQLLFIVNWCGGNGA